MYQNITHPMKLVDKTSRNVLCAVQGCFKPSLPADGVVGSMTSRLDWVSLRYSGVFGRCPVHDRVSLVRRKGRRALRAPREWWGYRDQGRKDREDAAHQLAGDG